MSDYGERKCLVCGKEFEPELAQCVCCSPACQKQRDKILKKRWRENKRPSIEKRLVALEARITALEVRVPTQKVFDMLLGTNKPVQDDIGRDYEKALEEESRSNSPALDNEIEAGLAEEAEEARKIELDHCMRMRLDATTLPCGDRAECWRPKKCPRVPAGKPRVDSNFAIYTVDKDDSLQSYPARKRGRAKKEAV